MIPTREIPYESQHPVFIELHATAILCLPSGGCLEPDPAICAALMSAIYSSVGEAVVLHRELMVRVLVKFPKQILNQRSGPELSTSLSVRTAMLTYLLAFM